MLSTARWRFSGVVVAIGIAATTSCSQSDDTSSDDLLPDEVRAAVLEEFEQRSIPTTPEDGVAMRSCAGVDVVERMESPSIDGPSDDDRAIYRRCIETLGLQSSLGIEIEMIDIPEFAENHNRTTQSQAKCIADKGWAIEVLPPDENGLMYWEPGDDVLNNDDSVDENFARDADACVSQN